MSLIRIFDAAIEAGDRLHAAIEAKEKRERLASQFARKCGNCERWMKSSECPLEVNVNGQTRGPSMNHSECEKFSPTKEAIEAKKKLDAAQ